MALNYRKIPWYHRKPLLKDSLFTDLQNGSYVASIFTLVECIYMAILVIFDIYCLAEAQPGSRHYRYFGISFLFVYSGNFHVRNLLLTESVISFFLAIYLGIASVILMMALKKENERKFRHWLIAIVLFTSWRFVGTFFRSLVNDLYFSYHQAMLVIWILLMVANVFFGLVVLSNYQELSNITRLEDMAKLKVGTLSSLSASISRHSSESMKNAHNFTSSPKGSSSTASA
ncbi:uncharacterized protein pasi2 [Centruroides vittatus]|uniref:uncharacterized protein pasi2 n=1 Tax=Centruroides vittatus TaxID=120091 RepID=UPI00350FEDAF